MVNMNTAADKFLSDNNLSNERAVIESQGFSLAFNGKTFLIQDPVIQAVHGKKTAKWTGANLSDLIADAQAARIAFENENKGKGTEPVVEPVTEPVADSVGGARLVCSNPITDPEAPVAPVADQPQPETVVEPQPEPVVEPVPDAEPVADLPAPTELSGDIELDDTGKRLRKEKVEKAPKVPFANRYERSAKILLGNLSITSAQLAKEAGMSDSMAVYCIESFVGTVKAFLAAGIIAKNKTSMVTYVKPEAKKAKASK